MLLSEADNFNERLGNLDTDAHEGLCIVLNHLLDVLESDEGCAVTLIDSKGSGHITVMGLGNKALINPLLGAAADIYETVVNHPEGLMQ